MEEPHVAGGVMQPWHDTQHMSTDRRHPHLPACMEERPVAERILLLDQQGTSVPLLLQSRLVDPLCQAGRGLLTHLVVLEQLSKGWH